jgi:hypothetical protein
MVLLTSRVRRISSMEPSLGHIWAASLLIFDVSRWQLLTAKTAIHLRRRGIGAG